MTEQPENSEWTAVEKWLEKTVDIEPSELDNKIDELRSNTQGKLAWHRFLAEGDNTAMEVLDMIVQGYDRDFASTLLPQSNVPGATESVRGNMWNQYDNWKRKQK